MQTLDNSHLNSLFTLSAQEQADLPPVAQACLRIALKAHEGQPRKKKKDGIDVPYIHHPIGAMKILLSVGMVDDITLGAALLHDALEDDGPYSFKHFIEQERSDNLSEREAHRRAVHQACKQLKQDLKKEISQEFVNHHDYDTGRAEYLAACLTDALLVPIKQLTNPPINKDSHGDHKRFIQVNKAYQYTPRSKRVKMAELCATMVEDMLSESQDITPQRLTQLHNRMLTICDLCKEVRPELFDLAVQMAAMNADIIAGEIERPDAQEFDISEYVNPLKQKHAKDLKWVKADSYKQIQKGVLSVGLDSQGEVVACRVIDDPGERGHQFGLSRNVNKVKSALANEVGAVHRKIIRVGSPSLFDNWHMSRKLLITEKIGLAEFVDAAKEADAISHGFAQKLEAKAEELAKEHLVKQIVAKSEGDKVVSTIGAKWGGHMQANEDVVLSLPG